MDLISILSLIDRTLDLIHKLNSNVEDREEYVNLRADVRHQRLELARSLGTAPAGDDVDHGVLVADDVIEEGNLIGERVAFGDEGFEAPKLTDGDPEDSEDEADSQSE